MSLNSCTTDSNLAWSSRMISPFHIRRHVLWTLLSLCTAMAGPLAAQTVLTLGDIQRVARENAEELAIARLGVENAEHGVRIARSQRLPRFDLGASYTHISETAQIDLAIPGLFSRTIAFGDGNIAEAALTASVPLFSGFRLQAAQSVQEIHRDIAVTELRRSDVTLRNRIAAMYLSALQSLRSRAIYEGQIGYLAAQLEMTKLLAAQGQVLPYDTLLLSTRLSALHVERATAETQYRNHLLQLADLAGIGTPFLIRDELPELSPLPTTDATALEHTAMEQRQDIIALRQRIAATEERERIERANLLPTVSAFASLRYGRPGVDQISNDWMDYSTAGISLQWNLWSWGGDRARIAQQEITRDETRLRLSRLVRQIHTRIATVLNELSVLRETQGLLAEQLRQEAAKRDLLHARFRQGLATATEVVDAETAHTTALLRREQSDILLLLKLTELADVIGVGI